MGTSNFQSRYPFTAGEALNTAGHVGVAIAIDDGKVANSGLEATGVLYDKPASGQHGSMIIHGVAKARAGLAITAGKRVRVTTSGYFVVAASGQAVVGRALEAITSGSLGPIFFHGAAGYDPTSL